MAALAVTGGTPARTRPFPAWPPVTDEAVRAVADVVRAGTWGDVDGPAKTEFERRFAAYQGVPHALGVSNGTVALQIALAAAGIGSGDEVIVPAYTFIATASAVLNVNALPVFADVDADTGCLDPDAAEAAITERTKAILPVHLGGQAADLDRFVQIADEHHLVLIEDAAQAHGARWRGRPVGGFGAFGTFSFQASKNITAGEGGAVTTTDAELAEVVWSLHHCGRSRERPWYEHERLGGNHRLTEMQAALLLAQLDGAPARADRRERSAALLDQGLTDTPGLTPMHRDERCTRHAYHLYQLRYDPRGFGGVPRERFIAALCAEGVPASAGYGRPLDRQPVFAQRRFDQRATGYDPDYPPTRFGELDLPHTQRLCEQAVWIPQHVLLGSDDDCADVLAAVRKVAAHADELR
jgi:dTDP-4-amino-4,6-dideoxygalactose transaminase